VSLLVASTVFGAAWFASKKKSASKQPQQGEMTMTTKLSLGQRLKKMGATAAGAALGAMAGGPVGLAVGAGGGALVDWLRAHAAKPSYPTIPLAALAPAGWTPPKAALSLSPSVLSLVPAAKKVTVLKMRTLGPAKPAAPNPAAAQAAAQAQALAKAQAAIAAASSGNYTGSAGVSASGSVGIFGEADLDACALKG
jgi:hypothetical protein